MNTQHGGPGTRWWQWLVRTLAHTLARAERAVGERFRVPPNGG